MRSADRRIIPLLLWFFVCGISNNNWAQANPFLLRSLFSWRGGASEKQQRRRRSSGDAEEEEDPFVLVARAIQDRLASEMEEPLPPDISNIVDAFSSLSSSQQTFKGLDGAAHEAYQRTHAGDDVDLSVRGRARRSAARAAATADGLGACELCEMLEIPLSESSSINGTLVSREVILNLTSLESSIILSGGSKVSVVVLYEPIYNGGAGVFHGGIADDDASNKKVPKGRLLVIVGDDLLYDLTRSLTVLDQPPKHVRLTGLLSSEVASVQPSLYKAAGSLLQVLEPTLREYENKVSAIHFVGRSLAGGIANLAAIILDGGLPMPKSGSKKERSSKKRGQNQSANSTGRDGPHDNDNSVHEIQSLKATNVGNITQVTPLGGLGKDRTSSVSLGSPPCVSANVQTDFIISIMYGDDIVCRATRASFDRLIKRSKKALTSNSWLGGRQLNFMTDALSLTVSGLKSHAHGSEGEELRLSVPGRAYLLRPRRLGGVCSINEVGNRLKGGREALRARVFWQLDDILLSKSLWKHHQLDSYIHGLDRAHLRGFSDDGCADGDEG